MCGIAAIHPRRGAEASDAEPCPGPDTVQQRGARMLDRLAHRGPDDVDARRVGASWLGHRRLSLLDLEGGRQPLTGPEAPETAWTLVCNGEIYNDPELRARYGEDHYLTTSDSESALVALRTEGAAGLARLGGMWALCAATPDGRFLAARDRIGIKPLFWARTPDAVHFASELRAFDADVQPYAEMFPPGHWWTPEDGLHRFAEPVPERAAADVWDGASARVQEKATHEVVADSVRRHLRADVEVGVFLSGGLDSSLVAAVAAEEYAAQGRTLKTFAVGTPDSPDLLAAREAAAHLGTEHHEALLDAESATAALDEVVAGVENFDAGLIRSAVPNWFLSQLAARHVKAVLTGEGADELFAGYGYYHREHADPEALDAELRRTVGLLHGLNLQRCDRVTMAHGLEARVPFLDSDVIAHAMSLPLATKSLEQVGEDPDDVMEKAHLRRAFAGYLPDRLLWRRKVQFGTGSGAGSLLTPYWEEQLDDDELTAARRESGVPLRSKEELAYYRAFRRALPNVRVEKVLTRFAEG